MLHTNLMQEKLESHSANPNLSIAPNSHGISPPAPSSFRLPDDPIAHTTPVVECCADNTGLE